MPGAVQMRYMVKGQVHETESFDGTVIRYSSRGYGVPLITANGVANTTTFWHYFEDYFSKFAQVICWDYRGHGRSDVPRDLDTFKIPCYAEDLLAVMDHAGLDKAILIGFSMGVQVIFEFYRDNPERVSALIPINGPCADPFEAFGSSPAFKKAYTAVLTHYAEHPRLLEFVGIPLLLSPIPWPFSKVEVNRHRCPKPEMELYFEHIAKMGFANEMRALLGMADHSAEDVLATVDVPTLVISGKRDDMCPARLVKRVFRGVNGAELLTVPYGTHATLIEEPDLINYRIEAFLRKHGLL